MWRRSTKTLLYACISYVSDRDKSWISYSFVNQVTDPFISLEIQYVYVQKRLQLILFPSLAFASIR